MRNPIQISVLVLLFHFGFEISFAFPPATKQLNHQTPVSWGDRAFRRLHLAEESIVLQDYSLQATTLFDNMKTPASILAAGMVSLGFLAPFRLSVEMQQQPEIMKRVSVLKRAYIVVTLISFCSELLAVMWATVAVNQLTETEVDPALSVWGLLERDFDLYWAATNSHFVLGMVGFMYMVGIRGYVMLLAEGASDTLMTASLAGVSSALCLMVSVVNRGVESGDGNGIGYGKSIIDLFLHYVGLLYERATDETSFGPLAFAAIVLQTISLSAIVYAIASPIREQGFSSGGKSKDRPYQVPTFEEDPDVTFVSPTLNLPPTPIIDTNNAENGISYPMTQTLQTKE